MNIFNFFKKNRPENDNREIPNFNIDLQKGYLSEAAEAGNKAKQAVKNKEYDKAWGLFHEQKDFYIKHANAQGFTAKNALALDSCVHEDLANILRIEGKHIDAFFHILYWIVACKDRPIKRHEKKLLAYFNRCKFRNTTINDVRIYIQEQSNGLVNSLNIKNKIAEWRQLQ